MKKLQALIKMNNLFSSLIRSHLVTGMTNEKGMPHFHFNAGRDDNSNCEFIEFSMGEIDIFNINLTYNSSYVIMTSWSCVSDMEDNDKIIFSINQSKQEILETINNQIRKMIKEINDRKKDLGK